MYEDVICNHLFRDTVRAYLISKWLGLEFFLPKVRIRVGKLFFRTKVEKEIR